MFWGTGHLLSGSVDDIVLIAVKYKSIFMVQAATKDICREYILCFPKTVHMK
jgi:hypothetical protein